MHQSNARTQTHSPLHVLSAALGVRTLASVVLGGVVVAGCGGMSDDADRAPGAALSLQLVGSPAAEHALETDDASAIRAAVVTIRQVYLQPADGSGKVVLRDAPVTTDLLTLASQTAELVAGSTVPSGDYESLRFVISGAYLDVDPDGIYATPGYDAVPSGREVVGELMTPSFDQSGLKVKLPEDTDLEEPGAHRIVLVRFDVAESFGHKAGRSGKWIMHPVIEAEELDATAALVIEAKLPEGASEFADALPWVALDDRDGFLEAAASFEPATEPGFAAAAFPHLLSSEGPFRIRIVSASGQTLVAEPPLPSELGLSPGGRVELAVTLRAE